MYTFTQFYEHQQEELADAKKWHEATAHFQTDREREAYAAGYIQGSGKAVALIALHGGYSLFDRARAA